MSLLKQVIVTKLIKLVQSYWNEFSDEMVLMAIIQELFEFKNWRAFRFESQHGSIWFAFKCVSFCFFIPRLMAIPIRNVCVCAFFSSWLFSVPYSTFPFKRGTSILLNLPVNLHTYCLMNQLISESHNRQKNRLVLINI